MEGGDVLGSRFIRVYLNIFTYGVGRPKARYGTRDEALVLNNVLEHPLAVRKQFFRFLAFPRFVENSRIHTCLLYTSDAADE